MKKIFFFLLLPVFIQAQTFTEIAKIAKDSSPVIFSNFTQLGSPLKGHTINFPLQYCNTASSLVDGQARWIAVQTEKDCTITGIKIFIRTAGNYTGDNTNAVALYSINGGTLTKIAESANTATLWTAAANTLPAIPFTTPVICKAGIYVAALIYNNSAQTTAPAIASATALANANMASMDNLNSAKLFGTTSAQTALPATQLFSGIAAATAPTFIELY